VRWLINIYRRYVSPFTAPRCRFQPSCADYADEALARFGLWRGTWLALKRILRCQPLARPGYDPVPEEFAWWGRAAAERHRAGDSQAEDAHGEDTAL